MVLQTQTGFLASFSTSFLPQNPQSAIGGRIYMCVYNIHVENTECESSSTTVIFSIVQKLLHKKWQNVDSRNKKQDFCECVL